MQQNDKTTDYVKHTGMGKHFFIFYFSEQIGTTINNDIKENKYTQRY